MPVRSVLTPLDVFCTVLLVALLGAVIFLTPVDIPDGFPFRAEAIPTSKLVKAAHPSAATFADRTWESGLMFSHQQGDEHLAGIDESLGSGACAADFNNDGYVDLFLVNGSGQTRYYGKAYWWQQAEGNALFLNEGGRFRNATEESGLVRTIWGMGCLAVDLDNDGNTDLLVTGKDGNLLYRNSGAGRFVDVTADAGFAGDGWATSAAAADFNRDGLLDLYVGQFVDFEKGKKTFEANSQFVGEKKGVFDASLYPALPNRLYLNDGGFKFREIAEAAGVRDADGRTLDVSWQDLDSDGWPDLLVSNDRGTGSNSAYLNRSGERFEAGGQALGLRSALGNRGIASGDLDGDGRGDLAVASAAGENTVALIRETAADGSEHFKDKAKENGIGANRYLSLSGWSPLIHDFNNDGFDDLLLAAGHLEPDPDTARISQGQAKQLWLNDGNGQFVDAGSEAGLALKDAQSARGAVAADFDNDGDIDVYVSHNNDLGQFLANESPPRHWLGLKLVGEKSNRDAVGAVVRVYAAGRVRIKSVLSGEGFLSDSDKRLVFGLGDTAAVERLEIAWPSGLRQTLHPTVIDRYWLIREGSDELVALGGSQSGPPVRPQLRLKLGADRPELRIRYLHLLEHRQSEADIWPELTAGARDPEPAVRRAAIDIAARAGNGRGLGLLIQSLEDSEPANAVAAVAGLRSLEDEASVRWLLRAFSRESAEVKIALADTFAYFFQEEEAVVYRKYLAVPYLIRLLEDAEPSVRVAASRALANAERFRGVHALLAGLSDSDASVRAEFVRALGLIRQTEASPKLAKLLTDETQESQVVANVFVALKRLGDTENAGRLSDYIGGRGDFSGLAQDKRLATLECLLALGDEAAVFNADEINSLVRESFGRTKPTETALRARWISIWRYVADPAGSAWLVAQTRAAEADIRTRAFSALSTQNPRDTELLRQAWRDPDESIRRWALIELLKRKIDLARDEYQSILKSSDWREVAVDAWMEQGLPGDSSRLLEALSAVFPMAGKPATLASVCGNSDMRIQALCPVLLLADSNAESRRLAGQLLADRSTALSLRQAVLARLTPVFEPDALNVVFALAQAKKDPLRHAAIEKLLTFDGESLVAFARKIADNPSEDPEIRFLAVEFLLRNGDQAALDILYR
ncbi:FG-GAP-like repeat-containing protein [Methylomonas sp. MED-D]|uniref:FG-GAP-like repeat-containing protein n=1 Tax=unclassified Methylomonas TaxID=2608980 RepID=UPI0028A2E5F4|nr:FG-GAP-like repeat-containing protein [Methylomonas sp. MV1]MDT4330401.1 FG-GAP-like repeat-containing protein [Methylomonas sp. MV1]